MAGGLPLDNFVKMFSEGRDVGRSIGLSEAISNLGTTATTPNGIAPNKDYNTLGDVYSKFGYTEKAIQMKQLALAQQKATQDTEDRERRIFMETIKPFDDSQAALLKAGDTEGAANINQYIFKHYPTEAKKYLAPLDGKELEIGDKTYKIEQVRDEKTGAPIFLSFNSQGELKKKNGADVSSGNSQAALAGTIPSTAKTAKEQAASNENKIVMVGERAAAQNNLDTQKRLKVIAKEFDKKPGILALKTSINQANQLNTLLSAEIPQLTEPLKGQIARQISGEKGVLTEQDINRVGGSHALSSRFQQNLIKLKSGKFTKENLDGFKQALSEIQRLQNQRYLEELNGYARDNSTELDVPLEDVQKRLSGAYSLIHGTSATPKNPEVQATPSGKTTYKGFMVNPL